MEQVCLELFRQNNFPCQTIEQTVLKMNKVNLNLCFVVVFAQSDRLKVGSFMSAFHPTKILFYGCLLIMQMQMIVSFETHRPRSLPRCCSAAPLRFFVHVKLERENGGIFGFDFWNRKGQVSIEFTLMSLSF